MPNKPRIFVSYARTDGEVFAKNLHRRLAEEHGFSLWQDRSDMEGGKDWWQQIVEALKNVEYLILVMTPASMRSDTVRKEWRLARQEGVCVVPVIGARDIDFACLPRWMRDAHFVNPEIPEQWTRFIRTLESPCNATRVPFMVEDLPSHFVPRPDECEKLITRLFDERREEPVAITAALRGAGGYGKTTLAKAACHDERIQEAFHDGILWVTLGQQPDVLAGLAKLYAALTGERPAFVDIEDAANTLAQAWNDRACLVVIDDVWNEAHVRPFLRGGHRCTRLVTTRNSATLPAGTNGVNVDAMKQAEAVNLLSAGLVGDQVEALQKLAARLGEWPFLLKLVNGTLRERVLNLGQPLSSALNYVNKALDKYGLTAFDPRNAIDRQQAVDKTIGASLENLTEDEQKRYSELAIFPEDVDIPLATVNILWSATGGLDDLDTETLCTRLSQLSLLLRFDLTTQEIQLHDVMRTYLEGKHKKNLPLLHAQFVDAYSVGKWSDLSQNEPYLWRRLAYHFIKSERAEDLRRLLLDFDWIQAKLEATDTTALIADYDFLPNDSDLAYVRGAVRLSAHVLAEDRKQLASQLLGRLSTDVSPNISYLREQAEQWRESPWLRPLAPTLIGPGGGLLFTLAGHSARVRSVTVTPDGRQAISASDDHTLKVWDLKRGRVERTLTGHTDWVRVVVAVPSGRNVLSISDDRTFRIWDLETGTEVKRLGLNNSVSRALAVTPDGRFGITSSEDRNLKIWNLDQGKEERSLRGHKAKVNAVVVTADGRYAVSGSDDRTLRVWDLMNGAEERILRGHAAKITALTLTPDARYAISSSADDTIRIWDLEHGVEHLTVSRYAHGISGLAVTPDGRYIISASDDHTLKVWDLKRGTEERNLEGHTDRVNAVAVTPDGEYAVSASDDRTLKVWDLNENSQSSTFIGHTHRVRAVVVTPDGRHVISTSDDHTLRVWNLQERVEVRVFMEQSDWPVAITPNSEQIICAAGDGTLELLDLVSGERRHTFSGHVDRVRAVTVSPDGDHVISAADDLKIKVWNIRTGAQELTISTRRHRHWVRALAVTPDGRHLISASEGRGGLKVWNLKDGSEEHTLSGHLARVNGVVVTSNGKHALSASDDYTLKVWDLEHGVEERTLRGHNDRVNSVALSGNHAVSAAADFTVKIWNLKNGENIASFSGDSPIISCAVGPEGKIIVAGDLSGRLHFLSLEVVQ